MRCAVIGGGFAGLSAAIRLQTRRHEVVLLERRGLLGGRAASTRDAVTGDAVEAGTHLLYSGWTETLELLRMAGALELLDRHEELGLSWRGPRGVSRLEPWPLPGPLGLAAGLSSLGLPRRVRAQGVRFVLSAWHHPARAEETAAVDLERRGQDAETRAWLWQPLCLAWLGLPLERAEARLFHAALRATLMRGRRHGRPLLPRAGLDALHAKLGSHFEARGGRLVRRALAQSIELRDGRAAAVVYLKRPEGRQAIRRAEDPTLERIEVDGVVCAVPWRALPPLLPEALRERAALAELGGRAGVGAATAHLWIEGGAPAEPILALRDPEVAWVVDRTAVPRPDGRRHLALMLCRHQGPAAEGLAAAEAALRRALPELGAMRVSRGLLLREPDGLFAHEPGGERFRPGCDLGVPGLALAGDWVDPGQPAWIESAVRSGRRAARCLENGAV